ncbi:glycosyl hydrolase family 28-related protein [Rhizobium rhizogenes]|uniref:glycosyl hydrolase family 28-related protein n=1 Tax=Rhizobium rhizogenes TaxID=359 RepID=UPI0002E47ACD|nr:glycosyl hydrolase family 28-related protein [Rhizobium rhizogenes]NTG06468.1 hypothetical protein [Rhizobium rhizogenes]
MTRVARKLAGIGAADLANSAAFDAYIGPSREVTVDHLRGIMALHDGSTAGGLQFLKANSAVATIASRTALAAIDTTKTTSIYLKESGREGMFLWLTGDYSAKITADTQQGIYVKATAIAATAGAWVRVFVGQVSVKWFGAVGDGSANDTAAINAAIAMAKHIFFPAGTYKTTSVITIAATGYTLQGAGKNVTTIAPAFASGDCFTIGSVAGIDSVAIRGMTIKPTVTKTSGAAIRLIEIANLITLDDIYIYGGYNGIAFEANNTNQSIEQQLSNFYIRDCTNAGILCGGGTGMSQDVFISHGAISDCNVGMKFTNVSGLYVHDVDVVGSTNQGIQFVPGSGGKVIFCFFNNVLADTSTSDGWYFGASGGYVASVTCTDCWSAASGGHGINFASAMYGMSWKGGMIRANVGHGINFAVGGKITVSQAQIFNNSRNTSAAYNGINIASGVTDVTLMGNFIGAGGYDYVAGGTNYQGYGIYIAASSSTANIVITENNLTGNVTGALSDGMTLTSKSIKNNLGYQNRNSGTTAVTVGNAAIAVAHGLAATPSLNDIKISPVTSPGASGVSGWWFDSVNATQFVIRTSQVVATQALSFSWETKLGSLE